MRHRNLQLLAICLLSTLSAGAWRAVSPNGKISLELKEGKYAVSYEKQQVLLIDAPNADTPIGPSRIKADYQMLIGKRLHCTNEANEYRMGNLVMRLYNDGLAFRYEYKGLQHVKAPAEQTAYIIPEGIKVIAVSPKICKGRQPLFGDESGLAVEKLAIGHSTGPGDNLPPEPRILFRVSGPPEERGYMFLC